MHLGENPIRFGPEEEISIFVRHIMSSFHPSFERQETHTAQWTRNSLLLLNCLRRFMYKTWMESTYDTPNKNPHFFVITEPNRFCRNADSYSFIILKHIQIDLQKLHSKKILKAIDAESLIVIFFFFFFGGGDNRLYGIPVFISWLEVSGIHICCCFFCSGSSGEVHRHRDNVWKQRVGRRLGCSKLPHGEQAQVRSWLSNLTVPYLLFNHF